MSNSYNYLPIPPRVWSRVQNPCTFTDASGNSDINYNQVYIPLTKQTVSQAQANYEDKLIYKGNILQYKGNSAQFTKSQKYSQLARMAGPNRKKVYATQSQTYTNPNTTGLQRKNSITIPFPNGVVGEPNNISGPYQYNVPNPNGCSGTSLQDGGTLVCGTFANPCTGELIKQGATSATICNPASASDVPGSSILCWNNNVQTWFPKPRYVMNNSTDKWPVNYKGIASSIIPLAPYIINYNYNESNNTITLNWEQPKSCYPIEKFYVYENNVLIDILSPTTFSISLIRTQFCNYEYYIISAFSNDIQSIPSKVVNVETYYINTIPDINGCLYTTAPTVSIFLYWSAPTIRCVSIIGYDIYYSDGTTNYYVPVGNVLRTTIDNLTIDEEYTFYVVANLSNGATTSSTPISISTTYQPFTYTTSPTVNYDSTNKIWTLIFTSPGTITFTQNILSDTFTVIVGGGGGGGFNSSGTPSGGEGGYQAVNKFTGITNGNTFTMTSIGIFGGNGTAGGGAGGIGGSTSFTDPYGNNYTVIGGYPGQPSGGQVSGASYSGPPGTDTYTGSGGYGAAWSGTCGNTAGWGGNSYLFTNSVNLTNLTGINILNYIESINSYFIGGGGGTGGTIGGEGGGQIGNGVGGASSCSFNLDTQDAKGYGGGGAGYKSGSINLNRAGNGKQGLFILFFTYPFCNPEEKQFPGAPTSLSGIIGIQSISLSWTAPVDDGGLAIMNYTIYYNGYSVNTVGPVTSYTLTGLTSGLLYAIYVSATNAIGEGPYSNIIYEAPISVPGAPTGLSGIPGNQQITLSWTAPINNGGSNILNYNVYYSTDNINFTQINVGNVITYTILSLTNTLTYYIYVTAQNIIGEGAATSTITAIPSQIPGPPLNLSDPLPNQILRFYVQWDPPSYSGDSPFSNYILTISEGNTPGGSIVYNNNNYTSTSFDSIIIAGTIEGPYFVSVKSVNTNGFQSSPATITVNALGP
jgi:hypothetical protein